MSLIAGVRVFNSDFFLYRFFFIQKCLSVMVFSYRLIIYTSGFNFLLLTQLREKKSSKTLIQFGEVLFNEMLKSKKVLFNLNIFPFFESVSQANRPIMANGIRNQRADTESTAKEQHERSKESFEPIPLIVACLTYMSFYFLMLLGCLNQMIFPPKVATERNREVSHLIPTVKVLSHLIDE